MVRTQVSLDERDYKLARKEAAAMGISLAEFVRQAVRNALPIPSPRTPPGWMRYAGMVESGNPRSSESIDEIVHGDEGCYS